MPLYPTKYWKANCLVASAALSRGAIPTKTGKFELCDKGTVLLDEVTELSAQPSGQAIARAAGQENSSVCAAKV